jgi:hypothetical protein
MASLPCMTVALISIKQDTVLMARCAFTVKAVLSELHPAWLCRVLSLSKRSSTSSPIVRTRARDADKYSSSQHKASPRSQTALLQQSHVR